MEVFVLLAFEVSLMILTFALWSILYIMGVSKSIPMLIILLIFGTIAFIGLVSGIIRNIKNPPTDIRQQHIQQHFDEQVKYDEMIYLLDSINTKLK